MKKKHKIIGGFLGVMMFASIMGACENNEVSEASVTESSSTSPSVTNTSLNTSQEESQEYYIYFTGISYDLADNMASFAEQFNRVSANPSLLYSTEWTEEVGNVILEQARILIRARSYSGDIPEEAQESYDLFMKAIDLYDEANTQMPDALIGAVTGDSTLLSECTDLYEQAQGYVERATVALPDAPQ